MAQSPNRFARSRALFVLVTVLLLTPIATGTLTRAIAQDDQEDSFYKELAVFTEVLSLIRRGYVEETALASLFAGALDGTADGLDPLATYVPSERVEAYRAALPRSVERSGLQLVRDRGILYVVGVAQGSPGEAAGIRSGDILSKLDGKETRLVPLWEAQIALAKEVGTLVRVEVLRQGQTLDLELSLGDYELPPPTIELSSEVPVLRIPHFEPSVLELLEDRLGDPALVSSGPVVVDVRSVAGGDLSTAVAAAALFVEGEFGELSARESVVSKFTTPTVPIWRGPAVVLTNRGSQGASEVFAALLQQLGGASLVGERTFGHAGRRTSRPLSNGAELYYTDAYYVSPDGTVLTEALAPDERVADASRGLGDEEQPVEDLVLERAIELALDREAVEKKAA